MAHQSALLAGVVIAMAALHADAAFEVDTFKTSAGPMTITFVGHGTLVLACGSTVVHVDPWSKLADYATMPKADIVLVTHEHQDHLDAKAIDAVRTPRTTVIATKACSASVKGAVTMANGATMTVAGLMVQAVPAYNIVNMRENGRVFHPKGEGNGYVITYGDQKVYVAGDTENTPEMKALKGITIALLPMNLPYTMTPEMVADAARAFKPRVLYPYHFGETSASTLVELLKGTPEVEVRVRAMK